MKPLQLTFEDDEEKESMTELWSALQKIDSWDDLNTMSTHDRRYLNHLKGCAIRPIENDMRYNLARTLKEGSERAYLIDRMIAHLEQLALNKLSK